MKILMPIGLAVLLLAAPAFAGSGQFIQLDQPHKLAFGFECKGATRANQDAAFAALQKGKMPAMVAELGKLSAEGQKLRTKSPDQATIAEFNARFSKAEAALRAEAKAKGCKLGPAIPLQ